MSAAFVPRLIAGSGRSGTTWILDCLAEANGLRPLFEPLSPHESAIGPRYAYDIREPDDEDDALARVFSDLAGGRFRSRWVDYRVPSRLLFPKPRYFLIDGFARRWVRAWRKYRRNRERFARALERDQVLIKCIRANLLAGWLTKRCGFRTVFVVRHPCAVVESQLRAGMMWEPAPILESYRANSRLHTITGGRYAELLARDLTRIDALTLIWVIENQWPVETLDAADIGLFFYESLLARPGPEWRRMTAALALENTPADELLRRPSQQSSGKRIGGPSPRWRTSLTSDQLRSIQSILEETQCTLYSVASDQPLHDAN